MRCGSHGHRVSDPSKMREERDAGHEDQATLIFCHKTARFIPAFCLCIGREGQMGMYQKVHAKCWRGL